MDSLYRVSSVVGRKRLFGSLTLALVVAAFGLAAPGAPTLGQAQSSALAPEAEYVLIAWNDLGMHCMNEPFENWATLPPANTLLAQLIRRGPTPQVVLTGVTLEYRIRDNTYSVGKTDFWSHAQALLGLHLTPDEGITGSRLSGTMRLSGDHFVAEAIPLTPYLDSAPTRLYPYQLAEITARDSVTGQVLATTTTVAPVSTEMNCKSCHADGLEGIATGNVDTNILTLHDKENGTSLMASRPVLCADCHTSPPLVPFGFTGNSELPNLSSAIHGKHADKTNDCYLCHPGSETRCQRDVMSARGMVCVDCHGGVAQVANPARRPWVDLPSCGAAACHGATFGEDPGTLYQKSTGHGNLYCSSCHGTQHALLPSLKANDNLQNINLQGFSGTLSRCSTCHVETPSSAGPHGLLATQVPQAPTASGQNLYLPLLLRTR